MEGREDRGKGEMWGWGWASRFGLEKGRRHTVVADVEDGVAPLRGVRGTRLGEDHLGELLGAHALQRIDGGHLIVLGFVPASR